MDFFGRLYKSSQQQRREQIQFYLKRFDLWEKRNLPAGSFSKRMKQNLAIARALIHDPVIFFLDEPTANLDLEATKIVRDFILELKKEDRTIILNTHLLDEADRICDRIGILKTKLIAVDTPENLRKDVWGKKTVIQLESVTNAITQAIKHNNFLNIQQEENKLFIQVEDPVKDNPVLVETIISAGGRIQFITEFTPSLEDIYLKLIRS